jgi:energy-coupling factor transport system permease protein
MTEAFSLYVPRDSRVHKLHPLTKLLLVGFLLAGALALPGIWSTYILLLSVVFPLAVWGRILKDLVGATWRVALPFALSVFLIQGFLWTGGTPLIGIGPLSLKKEGLVFAIASTGRILVVISTFLWFAFTTRPDTLMIALAQRGLPSSLAYIIVATIQIVPRFRSRAVSIMDAQRARGLETGGRLLQRVRAILPLVIPLILSSLIDVEERALAIEARAFNRPGPKTSLVEIGEARWEPVSRWGIGLGAIGFILLRVWFLIRR